MQSQVTASLRQVVAYLDRYLRIAELPDWPNALNGLQVENDGRVTCIAAAVDVCQATIEAAHHAGADLLLVHHGLFWGGLEPITGRHGRRVGTLVRAGIALYAAHLPLDVHPDVGNNAVLAAQLGLEQVERFGEHEGVPIGVAGRLETGRDELLQRLAELLGATPRLLPGGPARTRRVGVITGAGGGMIAAARDAGVDTYVTGEGPHHTYFDAEEWGLNVIYAGHYATETVGVKALGAHLAERFGLEWQFLDHPTGL